SNISSPHSGQGWLLRDRGNPSELSFSPRISPQVGQAVARSSSGASHRGQLRKTLFCFASLAALDARAASMSFFEKAIFCPSFRVIPLCRGIAMDIKKDRQELHPPLIR